MTPSAPAAGSGRICVSPDHVRGGWAKQEPNRIIELLDWGKIRYRRVRLASVRGVLGRAKDEGKTFVLLIGTRRALRGTGSPDQFFCPVGTWQIAATVNVTGGKTVTLAELKKVVTDDAELTDIRTRLSQVATRQDDRPWAQVDLLDDGTDITTAVII